MAFLAYLAVSLVLYARTLDAFYLFDDLSILRISKFELGSWWEAFRPLNNGFIRPLVLLTMRLLTATFGYNPVPTHLAAVGVHALNGAMTTILTVLVFPGRKATALLAGLLFTLNLAGFQCPTQLSNMCDSYFALGLLGFCIAFLSPPITTPPILRQGVLLLCFLFALGGKETGVIIGPAALVLAYLTAARATNTNDPFTRSTKVTARIYMLLSISYAALTVYLLQRTTSYAQDGRVSLAPLHVVRQFLDYAVSTLVPYLHLLQAPHPLPLNHALLWIVRITVLVSLIALGVFAWRRLPRVYFSLLLLATLPILPACVITGALTSRYLYASLPFTSILLATLLTSTRGRIRIATALTVTLLYAWMLPGFALSPTIRGYIDSARGVKQVVQEMQRLHKNWPGGSTIAILDHPHGGGLPWRWVYIQHTAVIFLNRMDLNIQPESDPGAYRTYRFTGEKLVEVNPGSAGKPTGGS